jgi:hypothetical protein
MADTTSAIANDLWLLAEGTVTSRVRAMLDSARPKPEPDYSSGEDTATNNMSCSQ